MSAYSGIYTDLGGLARLRARAQVRPQSALEEAAGQFEALFTRMMLKSMRESSLGSSLMDSSQNKQYLQMFDSQMALEISRGRGLGLKDMLIRQLGGDPAAAEPVTVPATAPRFAPESKEAFVRELLPHARRIESELGVSSRAVLAHAALESGWGRHTMHHPDGRDAFNLFGIKADSAWRGQSVTLRTLEFDDGIAHQETARFRAYASLEHAMEDYARFLRANPRYGDAVARGADPHDYAAELQRAGYATDPNYARKLSQVIDSGVLDIAASAQTAGR